MSRTIHRRSRRRDRQTGAKRNLTGDIVARRTFWHGCAHDDVIDLSRIDLRTLDGMLDDVAAHVGTVGIIKSAPIGFTDGGAGGGNDNGFAHGESPYAGLFSQECSVSAG